MLPNTEKLLTTKTLLAMDLNQVEETNSLWLPLQIRNIEKVLLLTLAIVETKSMMTVAM